MIRDEFLSLYRGTIWVGGKRYWRGQVMYQPTWAIADLVHEEVRGHWTGGPGPFAWFAVIERLDDNSASEPRGKRIKISLENCFRGFGPYPDVGQYQMLDGVRAPLDSKAART